MYSQLSEAAKASSEILAKGESSKNNVTASCSLLAVANGFSSGLGKAPNDVKYYSTPCYMSKTFNQYVPFRNNREVFLRGSSKGIFNTYKISKESKEDAPK